MPPEEKNLQPPSVCTSSNPIGLEDFRRHVELNNPQYAAMLAGDHYFGFDPEIAEMRTRVDVIVRKFNAIPSNETAARKLVMRELFGKGVEHLTDDELPYIESPFKCEYGHHIRFGAGVYLNSSCSILDGANVSIGERTLFGPNVSLYTPQHPTSPEVRNGIRGPEYALPIKVGSDCWLGGNVTVLPGTTIGDGTTVGAASVVTRTLEARVVAVGNPARVIKKL